MQIFKLTVFCFKIHLFFQGSSAFLRRAIQFGGVCKDLRGLTIFLPKKKTKKPNILSPDMSGHSNTFTEICV